MNRFQDSSKSVKKNELVGNLLSYVHWLRLDFFIMENVADFMRFQGGEMVGWCVLALTMTDYQVTFTILQAGQFGIPTRPRAESFTQTSPRVSQSPGVPRQVQVLLLQIGHQVQADWEHKTRRKKERPQVTIDALNPTRPPTSNLIWMKKVGRPELMSEQPNLVKMSKVMPELARKLRNLSDEDRKPFEEEYQEARKEFIEATRVWAEKKAELVEEDRGEDETDSQAAWPQDLGDNGIVRGVSAGRQEEEESGSSRQQELLQLAGGSEESGVDK